ncbi:MAG: transglutaminase-like domain-containing protein [Proteobacteria bacterium]|nr:transglutaminase-like domain-containing protein [Pseudomonadota bacterium]
MKPSLATELAYYASPAPMTDLGEHEDLLTGLPSEVAALCEVVQGLLIHPFLTHLYDVEASERRQREEPQLRSVGQMLARIRAADGRPLIEPRSPEGRLLGNCRHFSTLLCALLRHRGVPARARCGFAGYFLPGHYEDHWVCEVWGSESERWGLVDAQLDPVQREKLKITIDPLDVTRDEFVVAGQAWRLCCSGAADPTTFGLSVIRESGLAFVCGNLVRDVAALNKVELLPWDVWGLLEAGFGDGNPFAKTPEQILAALDGAHRAAIEEVAAWTASEVVFDAVRRAYDADPRWRVPRSIIRGWPDGARVDLGELGLA